MKETKIAILGAGAMGSLVGAFLVRGGADVILVDPYEAHMDTIRTTGLAMHINDETIYQQMPTCYRAEQAQPVDIETIKGPIGSFYLSSLLVKKINAY